MTDSRDPICFTCGQKTQNPPRFNLMASGDYCPTCRDRVLDAAPALLPGSVGRELRATEVSDDLHLEAPDGGGYPDPPLSA